jgi:hypothetical protein
MAKQLFVRDSQTLYTTVYIWSRFLSYTYLAQWSRCRHRSQAGFFKLSGGAGCNARVSNHVCFDLFQNEFLSKFLQKFLHKYATKTQGRSVVVSAFCDWSANVVKRVFW